MPRKKTISAKQQTGNPVPGGDFPIVAIGASAGGLEAIERFIKAVPQHSGMAFVLIQHLDPTHKSILTDLIKRVTPLRVLEVSDGMRVEQNCAYVIPPNRDMALLHGFLQLIEPTAPRGLRLPIDFFFRSFAQDQGDRAICIVLSGTGTDGTLGVKAVKEAGGMVIVQSPESAKYDGMPRSAIATGLTDYILPPEQMAAQLLNYVSVALAPGAKRQTATVPTRVEDLNKVYVLLRNQTGHDFSNYKPNTILRRIERRMTVNQIEKIRDYVRLLQGNSLEVETLFKELLIGVSNFFRDPEAFEALGEEVIPELFHNRPPSEPVRVWVPGCATGEEAYSIAMLLREQMEERKQDYKLQVFATDLDSDAIETARNGVYPESIAADVSPERLRRFFTRHENSYQVTKAVRDAVVFAEQNVIKDPPFSRLDLVACRNLLIYMEAELQKRLLPLFHYALRDGGYLFLGSSESIGEAKDLFEIVNRRCKLYRRKRVVLQHGNGLGIPVAPFPLNMHVPGKPGEAAAKRIPSSRELTERMLLDDYAPASVLVSEKGEGLYFHGNTGRYLKPPTGEASLNILGLAREGLQLDLSTALRKVATHKKPIRFENVKFKSNGDTQVINLVVKPLTEPSVQGVAMLVVFEDVAVSDSADQQNIAVPSGASDQRVVELEHELRSTGEYLQTTIEELETSNEELKSTNEELQSANEELQSTNEELETSKEELQSVNEELTTVNAEHEVKLDELSKASNDMSNLLSSTDVGTIFLDNQLRIQRFTPAVTRLVNLIASDVGRPLGDITINLVGQDLTADATEVLDTLTPSETEVQTREGHWYSARMRPYRTTDNIIDGVVITFIDITEQKRVHAELDTMSQAIVQSPNAVIITNTDGTIEYVNPYFVKRTGYSSAEAVGSQANFLRSGETPMAVLENMWQTIERGDVWTGVVQNRRKEGTVYPNRVSIYPVTDSQGNIAHYVAIQSAAAGDDSP